MSDPVDLKPTHTTDRAIYDAYVEDEAKQPWRQHLGASIIGRECPRQLWYMFRWAMSGVQRFTGQKLKLFSTGNRHEARMAENLLRIGVQLHTQVSKYVLGGHFGGSCDGIGLGFPEAPKTWHVWENKTHDQKSFTELQKKGLWESKPDHWHQGNMYAGMHGLHNVIYLAENKNTDEIYVERYKFDKLKFDEMMMKAKSIISQDSPPPRPYRDSTYFRCNMCDFKDVCWGTELPNVNCRTCCHSTPRVDGAGGWECSRHQLQQMPHDYQRIGCTDHRFIPLLLENIATPVNADDAQNWIQYEMKQSLPNGEPTGGGRFVNGPHPGLSSQEIASVKQKQLLGHPAIEEMKMISSTTRIIG